MHAIIMRVAIHIVTDLDWLLVYNKFKILFLCTMWLGLFNLVQNGTILILLPICILLFLF